MVLVLDHLVKDDCSGSLLIQPQTEGKTAEPDLLSHCQRPDPLTSEHSMTSVLSRSSLDCVAPEKSLGLAYRTRLDSAASDKSQSSLRRDRVDSGVSERSVDSSVRQRLGSDVSDSNFAPGFGSDPLDNLISMSRKRTGSGSSNHSGSTSSEEKGPAQEVEVALSGSTCSTDSEAESRSIHTRPNEDQVTDQEQPDGNLLSLKHRTNGFPNGSVKEKSDFHKQKVEYKTFL